MQYIDVHITTHGDDNLDHIVWPTQLAKTLEDAGWIVRSVLVTDSHTGLSGSFRSDKVQHKIDKHKGN